MAELAGSAGEAGPADGLGPLGRPMRILIWHLHGSWLTSFVQGPHEYLVPVTPDRGPFGLGRARTWDWPASVVELPAELRDADVDLVVLQRPDELALAAAWLGRTPGRDVRRRLPGARHSAQRRHQASDGRYRRPDDRPRHPLQRPRSGTADPSPVTVIEHGIPDPGAAPGPVSWTGLRWWSTIR